MKNENVRKVLFTGLVFALLFGSFVALASAGSDSIGFDDYELEYSYGSAEVGERFNLVVSVTNYDDDPKDFTLEIDDDSPFEVHGDDSWDFTLDADETASKTFRIEISDTADSKRYKLGFELDDGDDDWEDEFSIDVLSDGAEIELRSIQSTPRKIVPGSSDVEFTVKVHNAGAFAAEGLVATLVLPNGFSPSSSYSDVVYVGDFEDGDTEELVFYFDVEDYLDARDYVGSLELSYESDGDDEVDSIDVPLPLSTIPQFEVVDFEVVSADEVFAGVESKVKVAIQNVGGRDASDVSLTAYERSDQPFEFNEKTSYVGNLDRGEIGYAILSFETDKDAEESIYNLGLQVRSVADSDVFVDELSQPVSVKVKERDTLLYSSLALGGLFAVLVLVGAVYLRRR